MSSALLATKLYAPPTPATLVPRPRLMARLDTCAQRRLTLISAGAGFGKTTLASEWLHHRRVQQPDRPPAWLSLDAGDNAPATFWSYFIAALQSAHPGIGCAAQMMLEAHPAPPIESILIALINDLAAARVTFTLVLDDYHAIHTQAIHAALAFLLDRFPPTPGVHLILTSRSDPHLALSRLRAQGQLAELRAADLRFTHDEIAAFLQHDLGLPLSASDVAALEARTEGWIAGLQLAALSMRNEHDITGFIEAFTGSHRFIQDYLVEEVLRRLPEPAQTFLLKTSILDRLSGPLCDAVVFNAQPAESGQTPTNGASQHLLESFERANLFIVPLDHARQWYRYHQLLTDFLRHRLQHTQRDDIPELHRRASAWYERNGYIADAVQHALAAQDFECASRLIDQHAESMWMRSQAGMLLHWLEGLPQPVIHAQPRLCLFYAWTLCLSGQWRAVEPLLEIVDAQLVPRSGAASLSADAHGMLTVIRASVANMRGDVARAIALSREALGILPESNLVWRGAISQNLGEAHFIQNDWAAALEAFTEASRISLAADNLFAALIAIRNVAEVYVAQGHLRRAAAVYRDGLQLAKARAARDGYHLTTAGSLHVGLGELLYEWNDVTTAQQHLTEGIALCQQGGPGFGLIVGYISLARLLAAQDHLDNAFSLLEKADNLARRYDMPYMPQLVSTTRAQIWLRQHTRQPDSPRWLAAASQWSQQASVSADGELRPVHSLLARLYLAQGQPSSAIDLLAKLADQAESAGRMQAAIQYRALHALALHANGEAERALDMLEHTLSLAKPGGYLRTFIDEGPPMAALLRCASAHRIAPEYVQQILSAFNGQIQDNIAAAHTRAQPLIDPLSLREIEVLQLVAAGQSNQQIAHTLAVAPNTIKTHLLHIYRKLDVNRRTQAVARARDLNLL